MHWARQSWSAELAQVLWERRFDLGDVSGAQFALLVGENEHGASPQEVGQKDKAAPAQAVSALQPGE
jgi:hypothetical protein